MTSFLTLLFYLIREVLHHFWLSFLLLLILGEHFLCICFREANTTVTFRTFGTNSMTSHTNLIIILLNLLIDVRILIFNISLLHQLVNFWQVVVNQSHIFRSTSVGIGFNFFAYYLLLLILFQKWRKFARLLRRCDGVLSWYWSWTFMATAHLSDLGTLIYKVLITRNWCFS